MSKKKRQQKPQNQEVKNVVSEIKAKTQTVQSNAPSSAADLPFSKGNYTFMLIGIGVILTGFIIMTLDKEEFGFGFLGITLGPIVVFAGFMIELYAILKKKA